jgi:hypothetical protein
MTEDTEKPGSAPAQAKPATAKEARLKAALKANMGRRKAQARARADVVDVHNNENE